MKTNHETLTAEIVELFGQKALFTNGRVPLSAVPKGLYRYELRDDGNGNFATVESNVIVNFAGTVITKSPLALGEHGYCEILDNRGEMDEITVLEETGNNEYLVDYRGVKCSAIFNTANFQYYADDVYGRKKE